MCINDFPSKYVLFKPKMCKKFIFVTEDDCRKVYFVNIAPFEENGRVELCHILLHLGKKGLNIEQKKFYIQQFKQIVRAESECSCRFAALHEKELKFRVYSEQKEDAEIFEQNEDEGADENIWNRKLEGERDVCYCMMNRLEDENSFNSSKENTFAEEENNSLIEPESFLEMQLPFSRPQGFSLFKPIQIFPQEKSNFLPITFINFPDRITEIRPQEAPSKPKSKEYERKIHEVISLVKTWRKLHDNKLCTLKEGAHALKMSKKSLDDYYLILRMGQVVGFDFKSNLHEGMGKLRAFVRAAESKVSGKLGRHIQCFKFVQQLEISQKQEKTQQKMEEEISAALSHYQKTPQVVLVPRSVEPKKLQIPIPIQLSSIE